LEGEIGNKIVRGREDSRKQQGNSGEAEADGLRGRKRLLILSPALSSAGAHYTTDIALKNTKKPDLVGGDYKLGCGLCAKQSRDRKGTVCSGSTLKGQYL
jgi:hypothetical protein